MTTYRNPIRYGVALDRVPPMADDAGPRCDAEKKIPGEPGVTICTLHPHHPGQHVSHGWSTAATWTEES
jgi:hypothetical protein